MHACRLSPSRWSVIYRIDTKNLIIIFICLVARPRKVSGHFLSWLINTDYLSISMILMRRRWMTWLGHAQQLESLSASFECCFITRYQLTSMCICQRHQFWILQCTHRVCTCIDENAYLIGSTFQVRGNQTSWHWQKNALINCLLFLRVFWPGQGNRLRIPAETNDVRSFCFVAVSDSAWCISLSLCIHDDFGRLNSCLSRQLTANDPDRHVLLA